MLLDIIGGIVAGIGRRLALLATVLLIVLIVGGASRLYEFSKASFYSVAAMLGVFIVFLVVLLIVTGSRRKAELHERRLQDEKWRNQVLEDAKKVVHRLRRFDVAIDAADQGHPITLPNTGAARAYIASYRKARGAHFVLGQLDGTNPA